MEQGDTYGDKIFKSIAVAQVNGVARLTADMEEIERIIMDALPPKHVEVVSLTRGRNKFGDSLVFRIVTDKCPKN